MTNHFRFLFFLYYPEKFKEKRQIDNIIANAKIANDQVVELIKIVNILKDYCEKNFSDNATYNLSGIINTLYEKLEYAAYKLHKIVNSAQKSEIPKFMKKMREIDILFDSEDDLI